MASTKATSKTSSVQSPKKATAQLPKLEAGILAAATKAILPGDATELMGSEIGRTHRILEGYEDTVGMTGRHAQTIEENFIEARKRWAEPFIQAIRHTEEYVWPDNSDLEKQNHIWMMIGNALKSDPKTWETLMSAADPSEMIEEEFGDGLSQLVGFGMVAGIMFSSMTGIKITPPSLPVAAEKEATHV